MFPESRFTFWGVASNSAHNPGKERAEEFPELFARLVPPRLRIFTLGDGLQGHFQAIFGLRKSPKKIHTF